MCLTVACLVAGSSVATESTECTVVELSIPIMPDPVESPVNDLAEDVYDEEEEAETEVANSSTESATGCDPTTPMSQLKKRKVTYQDIKKMQFDVLNVEKIKIGLEVENLKLVNTKLKLELEELKARKQSTFVEY